MSVFNWDSTKHTDQENLRWCWLRAVEWGIWPAFLSSPIVPILLLYILWWKILLGIAFLTIGWAFVRYKYVNVPVADLGSLWCQLSWLTTPIATFVLLERRHYGIALLALAWPMVSAYFGILVGGTEIGKIQEMFMEKLGYTRKKLE